MGFILLKNTDSHEWIMIVINELERMQKEAIVT